MSEEGDLFVNYGIEGVTFNWSDESRTVPVLTEAYMDGNARAQFGIGMLGRMRSRMFGYTAAAWTPEQREGNQMILDNILPGVGIYQQLPIEIEIGNALSTLISEAEAELVVCSPDEVEALYEGYVQRYMENGGAEWIEQATAYYQERQ